MWSFRRASLVCKISFLCLQCRIKGFIDRCRRILQNWSPYYEKCPGLSLILILPALVGYGLVCRRKTESVRDGHQKFGHPNAPCLRVIITCDLNLYGWLLRYYVLWSRPIFSHCLLLFCSYLCELLALCAIVLSSYDVKNQPTLMHIARRCFKAPFLSHVLRMLFNVFCSCEYLQLEGFKHIRD